MGNIFNNVLFIKDEIYFYIDRRYCFMLGFWWFRGKYKNSLREE